MGQIEQLLKTIRQQMRNGYSSDEFDKQAEAEILALVQDTVNKIIDQFYDEYTFTCDERNDMKMTAEKFISNLAKEK